MKRNFFIFIAIAAVLCLALILYRSIFFAPVSNDLVLYGNVDIRQVDLGFRVYGRIEKLYVDEGDPVAPGTLVAELEKQPYEDEYKRAFANVESVKAALENAEILYQRRAKLKKSGAVSQEELDDAYSSRNTLIANYESSIASLGVATTNLKDTKLYSAVNGFVLTRIRETGAVVQEAAPVFTVSIKSPVWVRAYIDEPRLGLIYPDMEADVYTDTKGSRVYKGHIGFISPMAEFTPKTVETAQLRTELVYRLRIIVDDPDQALRQGMPVTVKLKPDIYRR